MPSIQSPRRPSRSGARAQLARSLASATLASGAKLRREAAAAPSYYGQCAEEIHLAQPPGAAPARLERRPPGGERRSQDFDPPADGPAPVFERAAERWAALPR